MKVSVPRPRGRGERIERVPALAVDSPAYFNESMPRIVISDETARRIGLRPELAHHLLTAPASLSAEQIDRARDVVADHPGYYVFSADDYLPEFALARTAATAASVLSLWQGSGTVALVVRVSEVAPDSSRWGPPLRAMPIAATAASRGDHGCVGACGRASHVVCRSQRRGPPSCAVADDRDRRGATRVVGCSCGAAPFRSRIARTPGRSQRASGGALHSQAVCPTAPRLSRRAGCASARPRRRRRSKVMRGTRGRHTPVDARGAPVSSSPLYRPSVGHFDRAVVGGSLAMALRWEHLYHRWRRSVGVRQGPERYASVSHGVL